MNSVRTKKDIHKGKAFSSFFAAPSCCIIQLQTAITASFILLILESTNIAVELASACWRIQQVLK